MTQTIIWIHEDALRESHPVYEGFDIKEHGFYVWDAQYLKEMNYGFQRLVFIYETLCELGVSIYQGSTESVAMSLANSRNATTLRMASSPSPALQDISSRLAEHLCVVTVEDEPFVVLDDPPKLKRFFGYWKIAKPILLRE